MARKKYKSKDEFKKRFAEEQSIGDVLKKFKQMKKLSSGFEEIRLKETWEAVMGPAIFQYTQSIQLRRGKLIVKLTSSTLREELSYGKSKIKNNLNEALDQSLIKEVVLV